MPSVTHQNGEPWSTSASAPEMETVAERVQKLEQALAALKNTEVMEQYVAERVLNRLTQIPADAPDGMASAPLYDGGGSLVQSAVLGAVMPQLTSTESAGGGVWSWIPLLNEFRLMFWMYFDARYRLSRMAQFGVPIVIALMVLNYFFIGFAPLIGFIVERIILVMLAVVLYKILAREAVRYAAVLRYVQKYGR